MQLDSLEEIKEERSNADADGEEDWQEDANVQGLSDTESYTRLAVPNKRRKTAAHQAAPLLDNTSYIQASQPESLMEPQSFAF